MSLAFEVVLQFGAETVDRLTCVGRLICRSTKLSLHLTAYCSPILGDEGSVNGHD